MKNKTIFVTGGGGFIGSTLCEKLSSLKYNVITLDYFSIGRRENLKHVEDKIEIIKGDIRKLGDIKPVIDRSDIVIHLAGMDDRIACNENYRKSFDINVVGTMNIITCCKDGDVERLVFMSSNMVYGESEYLPMDERHPLNGYEPYATSKIICEKLIETSNVPYTIIRNTNTYGPRQSKKSLIPTLIIEGLTKGKIDVWCPSVIRDFQYVEDCADALIKIMEASTTLNETLNLGSGKGTTTGDIATIICNLLDVTWRDLHKDAMLNAKLIHDISKLKALVDWEPAYSLNRGISKTIKYYRGLI